MSAADVERLSFEIRIPNTSPIRQAQIALDERFGLLATADDYAQISG